MECPGKKISKACEPCRRRKIRCNGQQPCQLCQQQPEFCVYRVKARHRASARQKAVQSTLNANDNDGATLTGSLPLPSALPPATHDTPRDNNQPADPEVYRGITATHAHSPDPSECTQLFYGPSSNFAFIQQFHTGILNYGRTRQAEGDRDHEGGEGLDMFVQRSLFFGTPSISDPANLPRSLPSIDLIPATRASVFLRQFKIASLHLFPLFTEAELDQMFHDIYPERVQTTSCPQEMALMLIVLANGALATDATDLAETLYKQAKTIASMFTEAVTLSMIQFHLLLADFQVNMGRPNSAYLHFGDATRRAFAMGINKEASRVGSDEVVLQKRRTTIWCLYFHERWHSLIMGRSSALKYGDISCRLPTAQPVLMKLCELARIAEINADEMYLHKSESLQLLYAAAQRTHTQLRRFAEKAGIGCSDLDERSRQYVYYHAVLLAFRPFLITEALAENHQKQGVMWLREACRHATDAAQDSLVFINDKLVTEYCKDSRFTAFFIESNCAVLLYDSLWHPTKFVYNLAYVHMGLRCLERMVDGEPILNARTSISRMIGAVEHATTGWSNNTPAVEATAPGCSAAVVQHKSTHSSNTNIPPSSKTVFGSVANDFIHLSDRQNQAAAVYHPRQHMATTNPATSFGSNLPIGDSMSLLDLDVLTTNLYNFFPVSTDSSSAYLGNFDHNQAFRMDKNVDHIDGLAHVTE